MKITQKLLPAVLLVCVQVFSAHAQCISVQAIVTPVLCNGDSNGAIDITPSGGVAPYTFEWSNGETSEDLANIPAGLYAVTVTDATNCFVTLARTLADPPALTGVITEHCNVPQNTGTLTMTASGGVQPYLIEWSTGEVGASIQGLDHEGLVSATITDANGCAFSNSLTAGLPDANAGADIFLGCSFDAFPLNGTASVLDAGTAIVWEASNGGNLVVGTQTLTPAANAPGTYILNLLNTATGCGSSDTMMVHYAPGNVPVAEAGIGGTINCYNPTVLLNGAGSSVGAQFTYSWTTIGGNIAGGANTLTPLVNAPGIYTLMVTNTQNGCFSTDEVVVTGNASIPNANAGPDLGLPCGGGVVTLVGTASGTTPVFQWIGPGINAGNQQLQNPVVNAAGVYTLIVTDIVNGCTASDEMTVFPGPLIPPQQFTTLDLPCQLNVFGAVNLNVNFGTPPYTFLWSNGDTTQNIDSLTAGKYYVTVSDGTGCQFLGNATVLQNGFPPQTNLTLATDPHCANGSDGSILLSSGSAFPPFTYSWSGPNNYTADQEDISGLAAGAYHLVITDATLCTNTLDVILHNPAPMQLQPAISAAPCGNNGAISIQVQSGTAPYTYDWSNDGPDDPDNDPATIDQLPIGTYTVTVTDANGCSIESPGYTITGTPPINTAFAITNIPCDMSYNGMIDLSVTNGISPYSYHWSNGPYTEDITVVTAGVYSVTVTDAQGCTARYSALVEQKSDIPPGDFSLTSVSCQSGAMDGAITLNNLPAGAQPPFTFVWSGPNGFNSNQQNINSLQEGDYQFSFTDLTGCPYTADLILDKIPGNFTLQTAVTNVDCPSGTGGSVDLTVVGGNPPLAYLWSNGVTTEDISGLAAGSYMVTVTELTGCSQSTQAIVSTFSNFPLVLTPTDLRCFGDSDGAMQALPGGGLMPYTYQWSTGAASQAISGLQAGLYSVTVYDANGCQSAAEQIVSQPMPVIVQTLVSPPACFGSFDGSINAIVSGGTPPFTYSWSDGKTTQVNNSLNAGAYTVWATDTYGCFSTASATLTPPDDIEVEVDETPASCLGLSDGALLINVTGGSPPYVFSWTGPQGFTSSSQNIAGLMSGQYFLTITDSHNCVHQAAAVIDAPAVITIPSNSIVITNVTCSGGSDGSIAVVPAGGTPPYTFDWSNDGPDDPDNDPQNLTGLMAGAYTVTVTDHQGCAFESQMITVNQPASITSQINVLSNSCSFAVLQGIATGGAQPFVYAWSGPNSFASTGQNITVPASGTYTLIITDLNGCSATQTIDIQLAGNGICGYIRGRVGHETLNNCILEGNEPGLASWLVRAEGLDTLYGVTDQNGRYLIPIPAGTYTMKVIPPNNLWDICPVNIPVTLTQANDTIFGGDFPVQNAGDCPLMRVTIGTNQLRRCFSNNFYTLEYCNEGTIAAQNAYVLVELDPFLNFIDASMPHTFLGNHLYRFDLGNVASGQCGTISIQVYLSCTSVIGQVHCTEAHIFPDTVCITNSQWSGASLALRSKCDPDSMRFVLKNAGIATSSHSLDYIVVEDAVMRMSAPVPPLQPGDSITIPVPANGSTWRLQVDQEPLHPFPQPVALSVEGCTANSVFSTGFVNQFPLGDDPPFLDKDCTQNIGSWDPNDKQSYPVGYGAEHYVRPGGEIEYLIRFQNTGTDTAFQVHVLDTLSALLDPATIKFETASHPYRYDLTGAGVVHFLFDAIMLPDSNTNEPASHGFVKFSIQPRSDAMLESIIENKASIYFDFNDPVITNTTFHRIGLNFISVGVWQPKVPAAEIVISPNPYTANTTLTVKGLKNHSPLRIEIFDLQGNLIQSLTTPNEIFTLDHPEWHAGVYPFALWQHGRLIGNGKLVKE